MQWSILDGILGGKKSSIKTKKSPQSICSLVVPNVPYSNVNRENCLWGKWELFVILLQPFCKSKSTLALKLTSRD